MDLSDRDLLAKTMMAEAGNQGIGGMMDVGSVIMNRVNTNGYGRGVRGVIMKPGQISAWNSQTGYAGGEQGQNVAAMRPSAEIYKAADALLSGNYDDQTGGATHYYNDAISQPSWGASGGGNWQRRGDHLFGFGDEMNRTTSMTEAQTIGADTMAALGLTPQNTAAASRGAQSPAQSAMPQASQQREPRGILEALGIQKMEEGAAGEDGQRFYQRDTFKDTAARMSQAFAALGTMPSVQKFADGVASERTETKARNKTVAYLRRSGNADLADMIEAGNIGATEVMSALATRNIGGTGAGGVQSSTALPDQSGVVMTMRDGSIAVKTVSGETLTGQAASDFVRASNERYASDQSNIYAGRRTGTLEADAALGGVAEAARTAGQLTTQRGFDAYDKAVAAGSALTTMDNAIAAIDDGAASGIIYNMLPNVTEASASLGTAMNQMGLDVISSVTFGALSESEMNLAMETAVPRNLAPQELRSYLVAKRDAQAKARDALLAAARHLIVPGNTVSSWLDQQDQTPAAATTPSPERQRLRYNPETGNVE